MSDLYDTLTPAQQASFRAKLAAMVDPSKCPVLTLGGADLTDPGNRFMAIACVQTAKGIVGSVPGVLDQTTYAAIIGPAGLPTWEKIALAVGGLFVLMSVFGKKGRR